MFVHTFLLTIILINLSVNNFLEEERKKLSILHFEISQLFPPKAGQNPEETRVAFLFRV